MIPRRKRTTIKGTNLYVDERTGNYIWRRTDDLTGDRIKRSTKTTNLTIAIQIAADFEEELQKRRAGLKKFEGWKRPVQPLVEEWLASLRCEEQHRKARRGQVTRALSELGISILADLDDLGRLDKGLRKLAVATKNREALSSVRLRRCYQDPLKQFAHWLAGNRRYLERDPLAEWEPVEVEDEDRRDRRAALPEELARALLAAERLDEVWNRKQPQRLTYLGLLITAARVSAFVERDVEHLDRKEMRIYLGPNVGNKRRGEAKLDVATFEEIVSSLEQRKTGPLFRSPNENRIDKKNLLADWREAFSLGIVDELWPADTPRKLTDEVLVSGCLLAGKVVVGAGGNPNVMTKETKAERAKEAARIGALVERLHDTWADRMTGIDIHSLRKTHRTWAEAKGVHPILIDKQLGHSTPSGLAALDAAKSILASPTGRKHYVDMNLEVLDARRSANAVREMLDSAAAALTNAPSALHAAMDEEPEKTKPAAPVAHAGHGLAHGRESRSSSGKKKAAPCLGGGHSSRFIGVVG